MLDPGYARGKAEVVVNGLPTVEKISYYRYSLSNLSSQVTIYGSGSRRDPL